MKYYNTGKLRVNSRKMWNICLLLLIGSSSFAQPNDHGFISFFLFGKNLRIPIERISCSNEDGITLRAYGQITDQSHNTIILSLVLHKLSTDPQYINTSKSWLSLESKNEAGEYLYISFGFRDPFSFYTSHHEPLAEVHRIQTTLAQLFISNVEYRNGTIVLSGNFTSSHMNNSEGITETVEIQDGRFTFVVEENEINTSAIEEESPSPFDSSILPASYFILTPHMQSVSKEGESFIDPAVPLPNHIQPLQKNPRSQQEYKQRSIRSSRGVPLTNPQTIIGKSSNRENQQPSDTTTQNQTIRTSGVRRRGR